MQEVEPTPAFKSSIEVLLGTFADRSPGRRCKTLKSRMNPVAPGVNRRVLDTASGTKGLVGDFMGT
jgi:hypothetical protein